VVKIIGHISEVNEVKCHADEHLLKSFQVRCFNIARITFDLFVLWKSYEIIIQRPFFAGGLQLMVLIVFIHDLMKNL
jgi:hypothetical protein